MGVLLDRDKLLKTSRASKAGATIRPPKTDQACLGLLTPGPPNPLGPAASCLVAMEGWGNQFTIETQFTQSIDSAVWKIANLALNDFT